MSESTMSYRESVDLLEQAEEEIRDNWHVPYNVNIDSFGLGAAAPPRLMITLAGRRRVSVLHELISVLEEVENVSSKEFESESYDGQYKDAVKVTVFLEKQ